jgi:coenzyme F420-reducing hydrogenase alpha subunit
MKEEELIEKIEDELYEETDFPVSIDELGEKATGRFGKGYMISIWFNDMFGWALSYEMAFIPQKHSTVIETVEEFGKWYDDEGKAFREEFDAVKYPNRDEDSYVKDVEAYFKANSEIGKRLAESMDSFCERELENWD